MANINWCKKQKNGLTLISPNDNLSREYMKSAEETLLLLNDLKDKSRMWLATTKYYCEYFAVYSLFMKLGIKCEIHECTISMGGILEKEGVLPNGTHDLLENDKNLRIDNQYYLKNKKVDLDYDSMLKFILEMKNIMNKLTYEKINNIRKKIRAL